MVNTAEAVKNMTADDVISEILDIDDRIDALKKKRTECESDLNTFIGADVAEQLKDKDYGAGTVNVETERYKVKAVVSKKVKWDNLQLAGIYEVIKASGENPSDYIKLSYDVSEAAYKNWPEKISKVFEPARTVETSKPKFTFEGKE
jgi:hypothetical protein